MSDRDERDLLEELIGRTAGGDSEALGFLYERYHTLVRESAHAILDSRSRAADVAQDFFADLPRQLRDFAFQDEIRFRAWIKRAVGRDALDRARTRRRRDQRSATLRPVMSGHDPPDLELRLDILAALKRLDHRSVLTVLLHDLYGHSHATIASVLRCSEEASRARLYRARRKLADLLRDTRHVRP